MVGRSRSVASEAWWLLSVGLAAGAAGCGGDAGPTTFVAPAKLAFTVQPTLTSTEATISPAVQVEVEDSAGARVATARDPVTLSIGTNPSGGTLLGPATVTPVYGIASFSGLTITKPGRGYALVASSGSLTSATSFMFNVALGFAALSPGVWDTCGLTTLGVAYCWGLVSGMTTNSSVPVPMSGGLTFATLTGDMGHTCGVTTGGATYCWGVNFQGQLGNGTFTSSAVPVLVFGGLSFAGLDAGPYHTCGITTGRVTYCWGGNSSGQLGIGTVTDSAMPALVSGGLSFAAVSAGELHTCGLTTGGAAYCWGENGAGQLGNGTLTNSTVPVPVSGGLTFVTLTAGRYHTCGVTIGGAAYCWGDNFYGQLGTGDTTRTLSPRPVSGGLGFAAVSSGPLSNHTCGVTTGGAAYCWGEDSYGELGNGTINSVPNSSPESVSGGLTFASVSAGYVHTCGLSTGGAAYCWGYNFNGQLGDGTTTSSTVPVLVLGR